MRRVETKLKEMKTHNFRSQAKKDHKIWWEIVESRTDRFALANTCYKHIFMVILTHKPFQFALWQFKVIVTYYQSQDKKDIFRNFAYNFELSHI